MVNVKQLAPNFSSLKYEGTFGDIYQCKQDKNILVKIIKNFDNMDNGECNKKIIKKLLQHNNLMNIIGVDKSKYNDIYFVYIENVYGITLDKYIRQYKIDDNFIINIMQQTLNALNFLHKNKITHRDIKLDNIVINPKSLQIKIIDFGLSCYGYPCKNIVGTSGFFAPEMIYSKNNYDSKCDIWSLGCCLYFLVCNYFPFFFNYNYNCYMRQLNDKSNIHFHKNKWNNQKLYTLCKNMLVYDNKIRWDSNQCLNLIKCQ